MSHPFTSGHCSPLKLPLCSTLAMPANVDLPMVRRWFIATVSMNLLAVTWLRILSAVPMELCYLPVLSRHIRMGCLTAAGLLEMGGCHCMERMATSVCPHASFPGCRMRPSKHG